MEQICDFLRSVSVHFGSPSQNILKLILKSPTFVPLGANLTSLLARQIYSRDVRFGLHLRHIFTKFDKSGTFKDPFAVHFWWARMNRKLILKNPRFFKFNDKMTQKEAEPDTPVLLYRPTQQGCLIWHPYWVRLTPNGTNLDILRSVSIHFGSPSLDLSYLEPIWPNMDAKFEIPAT